jgi:hypothetical protein
MSATRSKIVRTMCPISRGDKSRSAETETIGLRCLSMHRLYYSPGACSMAAHIVLEEIGEPYHLELFPCVASSVERARQVRLG